MQGTVKWFSQEKGYGFITSASGVDHYFNVQAVQGAKLPDNGDRVSFESKAGNKGPRATNVVIVFKAPPSNTRPVDERISCPGCGKRIVPRMITYAGEPDKSVCPYCAATVETFRTPSNLLFIIVRVVFSIIFIIFIILFLYVIF